ncbi:hypothetical protein [Dysgonomonas sp. 25]|uniref:hypothetical protein n=1 Tax=Dysgonomonas sp. 25 TaxID=2302933 RepID=UPI0013D3A9F6|nr:hypothetical protein [Dysgonomonas sp. 25]NDV68430.1 hypothetical protein [Dysgonomonas sp. 25]
MKTNNQDFEILIDSISQALSEIKEELSVIRKNILTDNGNITDNSQTALIVDLLNNISKTVEQAKKGVDVEDLKRFANAIFNISKDFQEKSKQSVVEVLNLKVEELKKLLKQPAVVENKYSIDFKSSKTVIGIVVLCLGIGTSLYFNYNQSQINKRLRHNDIKYRYVLMKGGVSYDELVYMNQSYAERPHYRDSIERKIVKFEDLVNQKAYNNAVKEQKEKDNQQIDKKLQELIR